MEEINGETIMNNELYHYGVPGMKWGVRKDVSKGASEISNQAANISRKVGAMSKPSKKTRKAISSMSDAELRAKINRLEMEQRYSQLNPSKVSRGAAKAANILEIVGSIAAIGASAATIAVAVQKYKK